MGFNQGRREIDLIWGAGIGTGDAEGNVVEAPGGFFLQIKVEGAVARYLPQLRSASVLERNSVQLSEREQESRTPARSRDVAAPEDGRAPAI